MDVLGIKVKLLELRVGDVLVFLDAGAYSLSRACRYAGSIPNTYLLTEAGEVLLIRRGDEHNDIVATMLATGQRTPVLE